jgi:septal ring factor EnvC (AmiA/AmiB activator)
MDSVYTVLITAVTVLGSASAWRFYEKKLEAKRNDENFMRDDCRDRIAKLEKLLLESSHEKDEMRKTILELTAQVSELRVKVEFLTKERETLEKRIQLNG